MLDVQAVQADGGCDYACGGSMQRLKSARSNNNLAETSRSVMKMPMQVCSLQAGCIIDLLFWSTARASQSDQSRDAKHPDACLTCQEGLQQGLHVLPGVLPSALPGVAHPGHRLPQRELGPGHDGHLLHTIHQPAAF